jgi:VWFA-related protein
MLKHTVAVVLLAVSSSFYLYSQQQSEKPTTFHSESSLVVVDVVVSGAKANPTAIDPSEWHVFENGREQELISIEHQSAAGPLSQPTLLRPGWSNNTSQRKDSSTTGTVIILFDGLNMSSTSQGIARKVAVDALRSVSGRERFILFFLGGNLQQLSGFTSDVSEVEAFLKKQGVVNMQLMQKDPLMEVGDAFKNPLTGNPGATNSSFADFEQGQVAANAAIHRAGITLSSLNQIAEIVGRQPGRKSLIWLTSSFPISITPVTSNFGSVTAKNIESFKMPQDLSGEVAKSARLLTEARIAVYPILIDLLQSGMTAMGAYEGMMPALSQNPSILDTNGTTAREAAVASATKTAGDTGGRATLNNDLTGGFRRAVEDANDYYTLSFAPSDKKIDDKFRKIEVRVSQPGLELHYRPGYYVTRAKTPQPTERLQDALRPDLPLNTELEAAGRLKTDKQATVEMMIALHGLTLEKLQSGQHKVSLLLGYVAALKNNATPLRSVSPTKIVLDEQQYAVAQQNGLRLSLRLQTPAEQIRMLRAGVLDLMSHRLGTVDIETGLASPTSERTLSTTTPIAIDDQNLYPELGKITPGTYTNLFFNFNFALPPANSFERIRLSPQPPGTHALLALSMQNKAESGTVVVFALEAGTVSTTDPYKASAEEATHLRDAALVGPHEAHLRACIPASDDCTSYAFYERRGYLLKFVAKSKSLTVLRHMEQSLRSVQFSGNWPKHLPNDRELYTGPAVPTHFIESALSSNPHFPEQGSLNGTEYLNTELKLQYTIPDRWKALTLDGGTAQFERLHLPAEQDILRSREHSFFRACSRPLLHLSSRDPNASDSDSPMLSLLVLSPTCLGIRPPSSWADNRAVADFAANLSMLYDFGAVSSAHAEQISGQPFIAMQGRIAHAANGSAMMKRVYQTVYLTQAGDHLLAWFLITPNQQAVDAFPAGGLRLGERDLHQAGSVKSN